MHGMPEKKAFVFNLQVRVLECASRVERLHGSTSMVTIVIDHVTCDVIVARMIKYLFTEWNRALHGCLTRVDNIIPPTCSLTRLFLIISKRLPPRITDNKPSQYRVMSYPVLNGGKL